MVIILVLTKSPKTGKRSGDSANRRGIKVSIIINCIIRKLYINVLQDIAMVIDINFKSMIQRISNMQTAFYNRIH